MKITVGDDAASSPVRHARYCDERMRAMTIRNVSATRTPIVGMFEVKVAVSSVSSDAWERAV